VISRSLPVVPGSVLGLLLVGVSHAEERGMTPDGASDERRARPEPPTVTGTFWGSGVPAAVFVGGSGVPFGWRTTVFAGWTAGVGRTTTVAWLGVAGVTPLPGIVGRFGGSEVTLIPGDVGDLRPPPSPAMIVRSPGLLTEYVPTFFPADPGLSSLMQLRSPRSAAAIVRAVLDERANKSAVLALLHVNCVSVFPGLPHELPDA